MVLKQSGKLMRKSSGGERAWFLEEESEPRNKRIFLAGENQRADVLACLTVSLSRFWKCIQTFVKETVLLYTVLFHFVWALLSRSFFAIRTYPHKMEENPLH
jgi:hypothetical protein